jgi:hypothetical protein
MACLPSRCPCAPHPQPLARLGGALEEAVVVARCLLSQHAAQLGQEPRAAAAGAGAVSGTVHHLWSTPGAFECRTATTATWCCHIVVWNIQLRWWQHAKSAEHFQLMMCRAPMCWLLLLVQPLYCCYRTPLQMHSRSAAAPVTHKAPHRKLKAVHCCSLCRTCIRLSRVAWW